MQAVVGARSVAALAERFLEPLVLLKLMTELQVGANQKSAAQVWESVTVQTFRT